MNSETDEAFIDIANGGCSYQHNLESGCFTLDSVEGEYLYNINGFLMCGKMSKQRLYDYKVPSANATDCSEFENGEV